MNNATTAILSLVITLAAACGQPPDPNAPPGICVPVKATTDGVPDPDTVIWRPCEGAADATCTIHFLDRTEVYDVSFEETEGECYGG